jgi:hypothetical protein
VAPGGAPSVARVRAGERRENRLGEREESGVAEGGGSNREQGGRAQLLLDGPNWAG